MFGQRLMPILSLLLCGSSLLAQSDQPLEPQAPLEPGWEQWVDTRPVSGGLRVGVMVGVNDHRVEPEEFAVVLPASDQPLLCVELSSQDGRYEARLSYEIGDVQPGLLRLSLPTQYDSRLSSYQSSQVSILAHLHTQCDAPAEMFVVAGWNAPASTDTISVFVNSRVPTYLIGGRSGTVEREVRCEDVRDDVISTVAYNKECRVPESWFAPDAEVYIRQRIRRGLSTSFRDVSLPLKLR